MVKRLCSVTDMKCGSAFGSRPCIKIEFLKRGKSNCPMLLPMFLFLNVISALEGTLKDLFLLLKLKVLTKANLESQNSSQLNLVSSPIFAATVLRHSCQPRIAFGKHLSTVTEV